MLLIGRHLRGARDIYARLYRLLGVSEPTEERTRPTCCEDGEPPVDEALVGRIVTNAKRLRRSWATIPCEQIRGICFARVQEPSTVGSETQ